MAESRLHKSYLNARVNVFFYLVTLFISFFSRKIFLEKLGADFVGLTGTMQNLLGFLNLAELGIGASIGYVLYKPIFDKNQDKIKEIISVLGYLYRNVGLLILGAGLLLACFLPYIFADVSIHLGVIYFAYFAFLASALISYFVNYRQTLLGADQRNYVVTVYFQTANIVKVFLQIALVWYVGSFYLWITIELLFGILYSFILNWKINQVYPWLKCSVAEGRQKYPENKIIVHKARQMFVHKLAGMGRTQLLPFLVYAFTSLKLVAYYGNYMLLLTKLNQFIDNFLGSTGAGVGNLIAEGDMKRIQQVFWELSSLRFLIASFLTFALYHLMDPFITVWLGEEYILPHSVLIVILTNFFISQFRGTNDQFIFGYGLFHDTWAPVATLVITVAVALLGGYLWGLPGGRYSQLDNHYQYMETLSSLQRGIQNAGEAVLEEYSLLLATCCSFMGIDGRCSLFPSAVRTFRGVWYVVGIRIGFIFGFLVDIGWQFLLLFGRDAFVGETFPA